MVFPECTDLEGVGGVEHSNSVVISHGLSVSNKMISSATKETTI